MRIAKSNAFVPFYRKVQCSKNISFVCSGEGEVGGGGDELKLGGVVAHSIDMICRRISEEYMHCLPIKIVNNFENLLGIEY